VLALLADSGVSVDVAPDGVVALDRVRSGHYDAVLMDLRMPLMDGLAAARAIRALPERDRLPIIAITADILLQDRERCLAAGMNDHIAKPIERDALWQTLLRWIPVLRNGRDTGCRDAGRGGA
jgi:two-component system sensor histidine kinase/response regulator